MANNDRSTYHFVKVFCWTLIHLCCSRVDILTRLCSFAGSTAARASAVPLVFPDRRRLQFAFECFEGLSLEPNGGPSRPDRCNRAACSCSLSRLLRLPGRDERVCERQQGPVAVDCEQSQSAAVRLVDAVDRVEDREDRDVDAEIESRNCRTKWSSSRTHVHPSKWLQDELCKQNWLPWPAPSRLPGGGDGPRSTSWPAASSPDAPKGSAAIGCCDAARA